MNAAVPTSQTATPQMAPMLADFVERARGLLHATPDLVGEPPHGDHDLMPEFRKLVDALPIRHAAVLIPIIARPVPSILLTVRSAHLPNHPGQIAFPGGKVDPDDADALDTALREAEEEVGLARHFVSPLGYLDAYLTRTGFRIIPVVGLVQPDFGLALNPGEVDEVFEVPLDFMMSPDNHEHQSREAEGHRRIFYAMTYEQRLVWGVTAGILRNLYERMYV